MGVMACNRKGCDNIMCQRYSGKSGYICGECYIELLEQDPKNPGDVEEFMNTPKKKVWTEENFSVKDYFRDL